MSAVVLVLNAGSSSLKYSLVDALSGTTHASGLAERIGNPDSAPGILTHTGPDGVRHREELPLTTHEEAFAAALAAFKEHGPDLASMSLTAVGHRVVHGGARFSAPAFVDDRLLAAVRDLIPLAPLHNPANLEGMVAARALFDQVPHVAVFDTAFHQTLPPHAYTYAVPASWREEHRIRRYGFHGTSHRFVSEAAAAFLGKAPEDTNSIVLHLGNGASATAVAGGRSVETSMGLTPLEGLVMGTRSGDIDPAMHAHLHRQVGWSLDEIDTALNRESGLKALVGHSDFRELEALLAAGDEQARLAMDVYCHRIRKYVGAYYATLGRVDCVAFTAGIGERSPLLRAESMAGLERLGISIDARLNEQPVDGPTRISPEGADVAVLVIPTNEEWQIARETYALVTAD
jgi:acetate kinase